MKRVGIVGPGRVGTGLALALAAGGYSVRLHGRRQRPLPPPLQATWGEATPPWVPEVDVIILAVPDAAVTAVARELGESGSIMDRHTVLHVSGILELTALDPLRECRCALGAVHPLQSIADPRRAPDLLDGATAVVDGDQRGVKVAWDLARSLGLECLRIEAKSRATYHAAAVFASNYTAVLAAVARRLMERAGVPAERAWPALKPLLFGTMQNLLESDPQSALTGPVVRGDASTVRKHLEHLLPDEADLYRALARAAITLSDLSSTDREALEKVLAVPVEDQ